MKQQETSRQEAFSLPGGRALMAILAVLCLTVFAILALSTVLADDRLADASVAATEAWYQADATAEATLAALRRGETPDGVESLGNGEYAYAVPISTEQTLTCRVRIAGSGYEILTWQAVRTADWQADDSLSVWGGE